MSLQAISDEPQTLTHTKPGKEEVEDETLLNAHTSPTVSIPTLSTLVTPPWRKRSMF